MDIIDTHKADVLALANQNKSLDENATAFNNQRKLVGEYGEGYHNVFTSDGYVIYRKTDEYGNGWTSVKLLSEINGNKFPSLAKSDTRLISAWQKSINENYSVYYCRSDNNESNWTQPEILPGSENISSIGDGPTPVIASNNDGKFVIVYKESYGLKFLYTTDYGERWSDPLYIPETNSETIFPSITYIGENCFLLSYNRNSNIYYQYLYSDNSWSGEKEISTSEIGVNDNKNSQLTALDGKEYIHAVWQANDWFNQGIDEVIVHNQSKIFSGWEIPTIFCNYGSRVRPSAIAHTNENGGVSIYFQQEDKQQEIRRISNNGEGWDYDPYFGEGYLIGQGKNVTTVDRANINQRAYVWTSEEGPPYTIFFERETGETKLNKELSLTNINNDYTYSRRIGIKQGDNILSFQISDPLFNTNAKVPIIKIPKVKKDSLNFQKMLSYLTTEIVTIPQDVNSIKIDIASYSKGSNNLLSKKFNIIAFVKEQSNGRIWRFGNFFIDTTDGEQRQKQTIAFSIPQTLKGKDVVIGIEASGLKTNIVNAKYGLAHVYTDNPEQKNKNLISAKREINKKEEPIIQNYPNPFNPNTKIKYSISSPQHVVLKIFDILGRDVATLVNEPKQAGEYEIDFDASKYGLTTGIYFYQLTSGSFTSVKKFILMK